MYKILIVEDEELERTSMKIFLEENLLDVEIVGEAKSGFEAVEMIDSKDINLLLVDINIPGIDGMEVIKYARKKLPKAVIIITTAYDDFNIAHRAIKLKVDDFLLKPIRKEVLLESVKSFSSRLGEGRQTGKSNKLLSKFEMELKKCSYKASVDILRDYIDQLYLEEHDVNIIAKRLQEVAKTIVRISEELGIVDTNELVVQMEKLKIKYLLYNNKHDAYNEIIKMVDILFDKMNIKGKLSEGGMKAVIDYIERNLKKGISLEDVANHVNISTYYLSKIFKKEMGVNFITYVTDRKMDLAKEMLVNTDIPVLNIALDLAYNEANYFSKAFKKKTGLTPSEYREKYRNRKEEENETV
ncbi:MAG: response regulator [Anaerobutyricum hallii]|nr:response regulator [Anaerobutyricum hallii]